MILCLSVAWGDFPLITSVSTTALPIEELSWPSVTLCSQGRGFGLTDRVYGVQLRKFVERKGIDFDSLTEAEVLQEEAAFLAVRKYLKHFRMFCLIFLSRRATRD